MEHGVLPTQQVKAALDGVPRVALYIDKADDPAEQQHRKLMLDVYNKSATIPAYFVIDGDGKILSSQLGLCSEGAFLEFLARGGITP